MDFFEVGLTQSPLEHISSDFCIFPPWGIWSRPEANFNSMIHCYFSSDKVLYSSRMLFRISDSCMPRSSDLTNILMSNLSAEWYPTKQNCLPSAVDTEIVGAGWPRLIGRMRVRPPLITRTNSDFEKLLFAVKIKLLLLNVGASQKSSITGPNLSINDTICWDLFSPAQINSSYEITWTCLAQLLKSIIKTLIWLHTGGSATVSSNVKCWCDIFTILSFGDSLKNRVNSDPTTYWPMWTIVCSLSIDTISEKLVRKRWA